MVYTAGHFIAVELCSATIIQTELESAKFGTLNHFDLLARLFLGSTITLGTRDSRSTIRTISKKDGPLFNLRKLGLSI